MREEVKKALKAAGIVLGSILIYELSKVAVAKLKNCSEDEETEESDEE